MDSLQSDTFPHVTSVVSCVALDVRNVAPSVICAPERTVTQAPTQEPTTYCQESLSERATQSAIITGIRSKRAVEVRTRQASSELDSRDYQNSNDNTSFAADNSDGDDLNSTQICNNDEINVKVDPPNTWHENWEGWALYFDDYCRRTLQVLPVSESQKHTEHNRRILKTKKGKKGDVELFPEDLSMYMRVYICTHGWKPRKSRAQGTRPRQHIRATGCKFRFVVQWQNTQTGWKLRVTSGGHYTHNHEVSTDVYSTYPCSRGVSDPMVGARVEGMLDGGAKRSKIFQYLLEHDQNVIMSDVDNMVSTRKSAVTTLNDHDATAAEVARFNAANVENISTVTENESGTVGVISLSTAHMRKMFSRFSEVLLVDSSHKTNRHDYQLLTFMVMNQFGKGTVVQHSLMESNSDWHMLEAIDHFKRANPDGLKLLRVIIVDKDLNEIRVLQNEFPEARVLICLFHAIKWLKEKRSRPDYRKISSEDAELIDAAIHAMVYAQTRKVYDKNHASLQDICVRVGMEQFFEYFERNWDASQEMWVMFHRAKLQHFKNHTKNRLENFFGKIKDAHVNASMSMAQCIRALSNYDMMMEKEYRHKISKLGRQTHAGFDEELSNVLRATTHFACEQMQPEYSAGLEKALTYRFEATIDDSAVHVHGERYTRQLNLEDWRCDCSFSTSMRLPCRHAIAYRKNRQLPGAVIPWQAIDERWMSVDATIVHVKQFEYNLFDVEESRRSKKKLRTHAERYKEASRATQLISSQLADISDPEAFYKALDWVQGMWRSLKAGTSSIHLEPVLNLESPGAQEPLRTITPPNETKQSLNEESQVTESSPLQTMRLSVKASRPGRKKKSKKQTTMDERESRQWYKATEDGKAQAGYRSLKELMDAIDHHQPSLADIIDRVAGVIIKGANMGKKKVIYKKIKNPVLILDAFYILPPDLLQACIDVFPVANNARDAISVDENEVNSREPPPGSSLVEVVHIKGIGNFSRRQIELFRRMENLKKVCARGVRLRTWLLNDVIGAVSAHLHSEVRAVADQVSKTYPFDKIPGLEAVPDHDFSILYGAPPPIWLSDACIRALCERLISKYPSARFGGIQSAQQQAKRTRNKLIQEVDTNVLAKINEAVASAGVKMVMIPVNFKDAHWCALIVNVSERTILYYDSLMQASFSAPVKDIANSIKRQALRKFDVVALSHPCQKDVYNCGVFVCWVFIMHVVDGSSRLFGATAMTARRFELFYYILTGNVEVLRESSQLNARGPLSESISSNSTPDLCIIETHCVENISTATTQSNAAGASNSASANFSLEAFASAVV